MAREFAGVQRGQLLLMPPSLSEWLPEDHLVWTVLGAVDQMDLSAFEHAYRLGAAGRAPYDPSVMVALLLYAYARGIRSSRAIERACWEDVAFKLITGMRTPDHSTVAEFRRRHESEIGELFDEVLGLCREAGLVSVGVVAIDGTKIKADASMDQNRDYRELVGQILREAEEVDRAEDERYGTDRGDELPEALRTPEGRRQALEDAKRRLAERKKRPAGGEPVAESEVDLEAVVLARPVLRRGGRREWTRVARSQLDSHRAQQARAIARDREDRLLDALGRLEENHRVELAAHEAYDRWRASARDTKGRVLKGNSQPFTAPQLPEGRINLSDPDSRVMRTKGSPPHQSYNAQAAVTERQIILAAEITVDAGDFGHLEPMLSTALDHLHRHGVSDLPDAVAADAGYWHTPQMRAITGRGIEVLVPPDGGKRQGLRPGWEHGVYDQMRQTLATETGRALRLTEDHHRAGLRADQTQPRSDAVHAKRQSRRAVRVATDHCHPQPPQAPQPLDRRPRLTRGQRPAAATRLRGTRRQSKNPLPPHFPTASWRSAHLAAPPDERVAAQSLPLAGPTRATPAAAKRSRPPRPLRLPSKTSWILPSTGSGGIVSVDLAITG